MQSTERNNGFTLLEMLAVMAIMSIILATGIGAFSGLGKGARMRGSVSNLRATIGLARQQAIMKNQPLSLEFGETSDEKYFYFVTNRVAHYMVGEKHYLPPGVSMSSSTARMTFSPSGRTDSGTPVKIELNDDRGTETWTLTIYGLTGLVKAEEG